jgi:hypothetical protein
LIRDDGAVVYLNGAEVYRNNMPAGAIAYNTFANATVDGTNETTAITFLLPATSFNDGSNTLAVEIHQVNATSSDISMNLKIENIGNPTVELERGPYLQTLTENSVIVKWRTNVPVNSIVNYGLTSSNLNSNETDAVITTEHEVTLTGLSPGTQYFYNIGYTGTTLAGGTDEYYVKTAPESNSTDLTRIWVLGDAGTANNNQRAVRNAYLNYVGAEHTDMILMLGDNAYNDGTDAQYQAAMFENMYEDIIRQTVTWSCPGNHDIYSASSTSQSGPYYDIFTFPKAAEAGGLASGTEAYYSFDYGQIHVISLDSDDSPRNAGGAMLTWLENDLAATLKEWIVVIFHHPPYTKGSHDSDDVGDSGGRMRDMRENVLPILEDYGVDVVLSGHSHSYERSYFLNGHYGTSGTFNNSMKVQTGSGKEDVDCSYKKYAGDAVSGNGTVYLTAGSSGKADGTLTQHAAMYAYLFEMGSVVMEVEENRLDLKFINNSGNITDYFTIDKNINTAAIDTTINSGSSITLTANWGGSDFLWNNGGATTKSITVSPTVNTQYIVTNDNGCLRDTFNVTVVIGNNPPEAENDAASTVNESIEIDVLANDSEPDDDEMTLFEITSVPNHGGSATINDNDTPLDPTDDFIDYTPSGIYFGVEQFEYSVCDNYLTPACHAAVVSVTVTQNTAPVATDDATSTTMNQSISIDVLDNDSDINGHSITINEIISNPNQGGFVEINNNGTPFNPADDFIDFTPSGLYQGTESFSYEICDNGNPSLCDIAVVNVTVNTCADGSTVSAATFTYGSEWKYNDAGSNLGTTWKSLALNDACWDFGDANLGFEDAVTTTLSDENQTTFYFRKHINISNVSAIEELDMAIIRDDGAIVYVNGTEVFRTNMPLGVVTYNTLASTPISGPDELIEHAFQVPSNLLVNGDNVIAVEIHQENAASSDVNFDLRSSIVWAESYSYTYETISGKIYLDNDFSRSLTASDMGSGALVVETYQDANENDLIDVTDPLVASTLTNMDGTYVLDVYPPHIAPFAKSISANSDDALEFGATGIVNLAQNEFGSVDLGGVEIELLDSLATWKYYEEGLPNGNWRSTTYNDGNWSSGNAPLGFSAVRPVTTTLSDGQSTYYFRKTINIADVNAPDYAIALAQVRADDGVVIYINGNEVLRRNMPDGTITNSTLAENVVSGAEELTYAQIHIPNPDFITGNNTIAVEVHQFEVSDTDVFFDMRLAAHEVAIDEIGLRFSNINIPQGAIIVDARLSWKASSTSDGLISINVAGQAGDNAPTFVASNDNINNRTRTASQIAWNSDFPVLANEVVQITNLKSIVQEIVDRPGWSSGNALALFASGFTNTFYASESDFAPELTIAYVDSANSFMPYIVHVKEETLPLEYEFMTDKNPLVVISVGARSEANINIGYLGATSVCVAAADADYDELHIFNRFNGANKVVGSFGGSTDIEAITLSLNADSLFAVDANEFGLIELTTGVFTSYGVPIGSGNGSAGSITFNDVDGLSFDATNNWVWATHRRAGSVDVLFAIDPTTGLRLPNTFGAGIDYIIPSGAGIQNDLDDIAIDPISGNLLAFNSNAGAGTNLIEINKTTGVITIIAATGVDNMIGQGFHSDGSLYATIESAVSPTNLIYEVDTTNASLTEVGFFTGGGDFDGCDCNSGPYASIIEGIVFEDLNADGIYNSGDIPDESVMVYLVEDMDGDSLISLGDVLLDSILSDVLGQFFFAVNREGVFLVTPNFADLPGGSILTTPDIQEAGFNAKGSLDFNNDFGYRNNLLPVELSSFYGKVIETENHLFWITLSELNNSHFEIMRSADAIHFEKIGSVLGNGNSSEIKHYHFIDRAPLEGENYYQLKQVDFDGTDDFSNVILLNNEPETKSVSLKLWPNPASEQIQIDGLMPLYGNDVQVKITDVYGKIRLSNSIEISNNKLEINIVNLTAGYYMIDFIFNDKHFSLPFIKH